MIWLHCMRFGFLCIGLLLVYSSGCLDAMHFNSILTCCREQKEKHINNNIKARPKRYLTLKREIRVVSVVVGFFVIHRVFRVSCLFTPIPWIGLIVLFLLLVLFLSSRNKVVSFFFQKIVSLNIFFLTSLHVFQGMLSSLFTAIYAQRTQSTHLVCIFVM